MRNRSSFHLATASIGGFFNINKIKPDSDAKSYSNFKFNNFPSFKRLDALIDKQAILEVRFQKSAESNPDKSTITLLNALKSAENNVIEEVSALGERVAEYLGADASQADVRMYADSTGQYVADRLEAQKELLLCSR